MRTISSLWLLFGLVLVCSEAAAFTLATPHYTINIDGSNCRKDLKVCESYVATSVERETGNSVTLTGFAWYKPCMDGITPCDFLGYRLMHDNIIYLITKEGSLEIVQNGSTVLLHEQGGWRDTL